MNLINMVLTIEIREEDHDIIDIALYVFLGIECFEFFIKHDY